MYDAGSNLRSVAAAARFLFQRGQDLLAVPWPFEAGARARVLGDGGRGHVEQVELILRNEQAQWGAIGRRDQTG